jgi:uncharacterized lipoprotein YehR (DUF1307 family)
MLRYLCLSAVLVFALAGCGGSERSDTAGSASIDEVVSTQEALDASESTASQKRIDVEKVSQDQEELLEGDREQEAAQEAETADMEYDNIEGVTE